MFKPENLFKQFSSAASQLFLVLWGFVAPSKRLFSCDRKSSSVVVKLVLRHPVRLNLLIVLLFFLPQWKHFYIYSTRPEYLQLDCVVFPEFAQSYFSVSFLNDFPAMWWVLVLCLLIGLVQDLFLSLHSTGYPLLHQPHRILKLYSVISIQLLLETILLALNVLKNHRQIFLSLWVAVLSDLLHSSMFDCQLHRKLFPYQSEI